MDNELKAYIWEDEAEERYRVVYARDANQAKSEVSGLTRVEYKNVRVHRVPWADGYASADDIPVTEWFSNGYGVPCQHCGELVYDTDQHVKGVGSVVYHQHCYDQCLEAYMRIKIDGR